MKLIVTDDKLGKLAKRLHELFTRVKKGVLSVDTVLDKLQCIIEGKNFTDKDEISSSKHRFWRKLRLGGGLRLDDLRDRIERKHELRKSAKDFIRSTASIYIRENAEDIDLIILTPEELGYSSCPKREECLARAFQWCEDNIKGYKLEYCPLEAGLRLHLSYSDQPKGEQLLIPFPDDAAKHDGHRPMWMIYSTKKGTRSLHLGVCWRFNVWGIDDKLVFRIRKKP